MMSILVVWAIKQVLVISASQYKSFVGFTCLFDSTFSSLEKKIMRFKTTSLSQITLLIQNTIIFTREPLMRSPYWVSPWTPWTLRNWASLLHLSHSVEIQLMINSFGQLQYLSKEFSMSSRTKRLAFMSPVILFISQKWLWVCGGAISWWWWSH